MSNAKLPLHRPTSATPQPQEVLWAWFGPQADEQSELEVIQANQAWWFNGGEAVDERLREDFGPWIEAAVEGQLDHWRESGEGRMALVILLDQMTRNVYRGTPRAFAGDERARAIVERDVELGTFARRRPLQRIFLGLPWEHHEDIESQKRAIDTMAEALKEVEGGPAQRPFELFLDYAYRHEAVVARFGRFPHRNAILGRESSPEEVAFLKTPNSSF